MHAIPDNRTAQSCVSLNVSRFVIAASVVVALVTFTGGQAAADELPFAELPGAGDCHPTDFPWAGPVQKPRTMLPSRPTLLLATGPRAELSFESEYHIVPYRIVESQGDLSRVEVRLDDGPLELLLRRFDGGTYRACFRVSRSVSVGHHVRAIQTLVTDHSLGLRVDSNAVLAVVEWSDGRRQISWPDLVSLDRVTPNGPLGFRVVGVFPDGVETTALQSIYYRAGAPSPARRIPWRGLLLLVTAAIVIAGVRRVSAKPRYDAA